MERGVLRIAISIIVACSFSAQAISSPTTDHLEPPPFAAEPKYRQLLLSKLAVTPYDYGRVLVLPFEGGEDCQSVYAKLKKNRRVYYITRTSLDKNLWHLTDGGHDPEMARSVTVRRVDAEIPEETAQLLKQVWIAMLEGPQAPRPTPTPDPHILPQLHPMYLEFSIHDADRPFVGALNLSGGYAGQKTKRFSHLAELTYYYCIADAERPSIGRKIDEEARRLLELLSSQHP